MTTVDEVSAAARELRRAEGHPVVAYMVDRIDPYDVGVLYECLSSMGTVDTLDLVLYTGGGNVEVARHLALILRDHCQQLRVLVPDLAQSAGTLLCLAADEVVLGTMAQLGPFDPQISALGRSAGDGPDHVSSEDVRLFRQVASEWFGMDAVADGADAFRSLGQRIFPTTLTALYRADRNIRLIGQELFAYQRPDLDPAVRASIVDHLVDGFHSHGHVITPAEATTLGFNVSRPSTSTEELMWRLSRALLHNWEAESHTAEGWLTGVIASDAGYCARSLLTGSGDPGLQREVRRRWVRYDNARFHATNEGTP